MTIYNINSYIVLVQNNLPVSHSQPVNPGGHTKSESLLHPPLEATITSDPKGFFEHQFTPIQTKHKIT